MYPKIHHPMPSSNCEAGYLAIYYKFPKSLLQRNILLILTNPNQPFERILNRLHIHLHIFGGMEYLPHIHGLAFAVHLHQHDGNPSAFGDMIKAAFPLLDPMPCPFGGNDQNKMLSFFTSLHRLLHQPCGLRSVNGYASAIIKEPANRAAEQLHLAHVTRIYFQAKDNAEEQDEVPVRGVGRADDDVLLEVGEYPIHAPAKQTHDRVAQ